MIKILANTALCFVRGDIYGLALQSWDDSLEMILSALLQTLPASVSLSLKKGSVMG